MAEICKQLIEAGIEYVFCTCQPHLLSMYHRLGFVSYGAKVYNDPEFGIMVPLILAMGDKNHISKVRSPLQAIFNEGSYNAELLEKVKVGMGSKTIKETAKNNDGEGIIQSILSIPNVEKALFFDDFEEDEINKVISSGHVIECQPGDRIIKEGQITKTVFVPLKGELLVKKDYQLISVIQSGEMIGELSFMLDGRRSADVFASKNGAKVLSLEERTLRKLIDKKGTIATNLLLNMGRSLALRVARTTQLVENNFKN